MTAAPGIERYVIGLRRRERLGKLLSIAAGDGLTALLVLLAVDALLPSLLPVFLVLASAWITLRLMVVMLGPLTRMQAIGRSLGLRDDLATWSSADATTRESVMFGWLTRRLDLSLQALPIERVRAVSRVSLGRLRYLLPLVILLLLLRLLAPLLPPLPEGVVELPKAAGAGSGSRGGGDSGQAQGQGASAPRPAESEGLQQEEPTQPAQEQQSDAQEPPREESELPPEPLIEGVEQDRSFLMPGFVGAGESHPGQAPAGGLDQTAPQARGARRPEQADKPADPLAAEQFERALERALRSRHVPAAERPFVRRYFEALLRGGR